MSRSELRVPVAAVALTATFVTALVTAQVISPKLLAVTLPVVGAVSAAGGTLAYAATFFASDCLAELYGERYTRRVVNVTFLMNFLLLALVFLAIELPAARGSVDPDAFATVLGLSGNIVAGSLAAYVFSQNWDVFVFGRLHDATQGRLLWLRNLVSTGTSQLIDTAIFNIVAFLVAPVAVGNDPFSLPLIGSLIVGQYVLKLLIALVDTPLVYVAVAIADRDDTAGGGLGIRG